jgi:hypothetical protein
VNLRETISWLKTKKQAALFPHGEEYERDPLTEKQKRLTATMEVVRIEDINSRSNRKAYAISTLCILLGFYDNK